MNEAAVLAAVEAFGQVDMARADGATCRKLLARSRHGRGFFDAADAQLLSRLGELHGDQGGAPPTDLRNLIPLCSRHHHVVHDGGRQLDLATDRTLTIRRSDGTLFGRCRPGIIEQRSRSRRRHRRTAP